MVQLEEVEDEEFDRVQEGGQALHEDDDYTDTDSSISDDEEVSVEATESLSERILALRDMLPPATRRKITNGAETIASYVKSGLWFGGKAAWVVSTSALLLGVPFALAWGEEMQIEQAEMEERARQMSNEVLTPGATVGGQQQSKPAL